MRPKDPVSRVSGHHVESTGVLTPRNPPLGVLSHGCRFGQVGADQGVRRRPRTASKRGVGLLPLCRLGLGPRPLKVPEGVSQASP